MRDRIFVKSVGGRIILHRPASASIYVDPLCHAFVDSAEFDSMLAKERRNQTLRSVKKQLFITILVVIFGLFLSPILNQMISFELKKMEDNIAKIFLASEQRKNERIERFKASINKIKYILREIEL